MGGRRELLRRLSSRDIAEWMAFYIIEASDADPEVTEFDDEKSARAKLAAEAERALASSGR